MCELRVMGLDISLRSTGVAVADVDAKMDSLVMSGVLSCRGVIKGSKYDDGTQMKYEDLTDPERTLAMGKKVKGVVEHTDPDLVVIEGYAYSSPQRTRLPVIGEVTGIIKHHLVNEGRLFTIVSPSMLKKFATDKGNCKKELVVDQLNKWLDRRGMTAVIDDDQADAIWLAVFGVCLLAGTWRNHNAQRKRWTKYQDAVIDRFEMPNYGTAMSVDHVESKAQSRALTRGKKSK